MSVSRSGLLSLHCSTLGSATQIGARTLRSVEYVQVMRPQKSDMPWVMSSVAKVMPLISIR